MKEEHKKLWIKALRSGKYKQGVSKLRDPDSNYCCLGVLCCIYQKSHPDVKWKRGFNFNSLNEENYFNFRILNQENYLPEKIARYFGVNSILDVEVNFKGKTVCVSKLNDDGYSFKTIADAIEKTDIIRHPEYA